MTLQRLYAESALDPRTQTAYSVSSRKKPFTLLHDHDFYEITLVTRGTVKHHINGDTQILPSGAMVFLRPWDAHSLEGVGDDDFEYVNIAFSRQTLLDLLAYLDGGFCTERFHQALTPPTVSLSTVEAIAIRQKFARLSLLPADDAEAIKAYARLLIADLFFLYPQDANADKRLGLLWLDDLTRGMRAPGNFSLGAAQMVRLSGKSLAHISRTFRQRLQTTPTAFVNDLRLNYCVNRLIHSDAPIIDIAMDAGFHNLSHFYHLFKQRYGSSPSRFRKDNASFC